jgi:hypothetical protein
MNSRSLCLLFFSAAVLVSSWAQNVADKAASSTPLEQTLIANTNAVQEAQKKKDVDFLKRTLADDFNEVGSEAKLHERSVFLDGARDGELKDYNAYNFQVLPINDAVAIVTYDCIVHMSEGDAPGLAPRYQHISDLWVKQGDQWRLKFQQATARRPID